MALLTGYAKQRLVQVDNTGPNASDLTVADKVLVAVRIPTDWSLLGSKNDLRVVRSLDGGLTGTEINRQLADTNSAVVFNIQADILAGTVDLTYYLVGENAGAGAPTTTLTTDTAARTEDFEDNTYLAFLKDRTDWTRDNSRSFAGTWSLKSKGLGGDSLHDMFFYFFGTGFDFYWSTSCEAIFDRLQYDVDSTGVVVVGSGTNAFGAGNHITVSGLTNGFHRIRMNYRKDAANDIGSDAVWIDNLTISGCPIVWGAASDAITNPKTLQEFNYTVPLGPNNTQTFSYDLTAPITTKCWEPYTQRLLNYLAPQVFRAKDNESSLLHQVFSAVARELSACTEVVALALTPDARGDGNFHVHVRFNPVLTVPLVERVDGSGAVLTTYTVTAIDDRTISVSGSPSPKVGDHLLVTYTYLHKGLEFSVREALLELNILTSTGEFLDEWGRWFGVSRLITGSYGSDTYGGGIYGTAGSEDDAHFSRRIIDRVLQSRNTKASIIGAVRTVTGGNPYIVEWFDPENPSGFIFKVTADPNWTGGESAAAMSKHLIFGRTARFRNGSVPGGGAYVFEVWVPQGSGYSEGQLLEIVRQYKSAGTKAFIRFQGT
jgi:hypothetical protein